MPVEGYQEKRLRRNPRVAWRKIGEEVVLVHLEKDFYITLDAVGTRVWELLGDETTGGKLLTALKAEFQATPRRLETDVERFLDELSREGMIELR